MLDQPEFERWQATAIDALEAARAQLEREGYNWACFLAEQAGQFAAKGLLHGLGLPAWGHDLVDLAVRLEEDSDLPPPVTDAVVRLSRHYIATRYPDAHPSGTPGGHYRRGDAEKAVDDAGLIIAFVQQRWEELVRESHQETSGGE